MRKPRHGASLLALAIIMICVGGWATAQPVSPQPIVPPSPSNSSQSTTSYDEAMKAMAARDALRPKAVRPKTNADLAREQGEIVPSSSLKK